MKNSQEVSREFIKQLKVYYRCNLMYSKKRVQRLLEFFGITKDPSTGEFMLVTEYTEYGNIRTLLDTKFSSSQWSEKIWWLCSITTNLHSIHKAGYVHGNIHPGNILQMGEDERETISTLADTGLYLPANGSSKIGKKDIYGVLPYMAPEVLLGNSQSKESDIYSIGILMMELASGIPPYSDRPHNSLLALEIVQGSRPQMPQGLPKVYTNLALSCCNSDPSLRPSAKQLLCIFNFWWGTLVNDNTSSMRKAFMAADDALPTLDAERTSCAKNSDAFYISRLLQFENVSKSSRDSSVSSDISINDEIIDSDSS
jgi:serine/threonine protein kinase